VLAVKVAVVAPAATLTEPGTVSAEDALLARVTETPPATAALLSVTVQVVEALEASEGDPHPSAVMVFGATSDMVAEALEPLSDAVRVAV